MIKEIISAACVAVFLSCNNQKTSSDEPEKIATDSLASKITTGALSGKYCYSYTTKKDSVLLNVDIVDSIVIGNLRYSLYEKDKNNGLIEGKMKGDTLIANYTFMSEGMQSKREVAFLLDDSTAKEGYGEMNEKNNKLIFLKPGNIRFDKSFILMKKECTTKN